MFHIMSEMFDAETELRAAFEPEFRHQLNQQLGEWEHYKSTRPDQPNEHGQIVIPGSTELIDKDKYFQLNRDVHFESSAYENKEDPYKYLGKGELIKELAYVYKKDESPETQIATHLIKSNLMEIAYHGSKSSKRFRVDEDNKKKGNVESTKTENANQNYLSYINLAKRLAETDFEIDPSREVKSESQEETVNEITDKHIDPKEQSEEETKYRLLAYKTKPEGNSREVKAYNKLISESVNIAELHSADKERQVLIHSTDKGDIYIKGENAYLLNEKRKIAYINREKDNTDFPDVEFDKPWLDIGAITRVLVSEKICPTSELAEHYQVPATDPFIVADSIVNEIENDHDNETPEIEIKHKDDTEQAKEVADLNNEEETSVSLDESKKNRRNRLSAYISSALTIKYAELTERVNKSKYKNIFLALGGIGIAAVSISAIKLGIDHGGSHHHAIESINNLPHHSGGGSGLDVTTVRATHPHHHEIVQHHTVHKNMSNHNSGQVHNAVFEQKDNVTHLNSQHNSIWASVSDNLSKSGHASNDNVSRVTQWIMHNQGVKNPHILPVGYTVHMPPPEVLHQLLGIEV